jgi:hypothetical protein
LVVVIDIVLPPCWECPVIYDVRPAIAPGDALVKS